jgi:hypothetical protein
MRRLGWLRKGCISLISFFVLCKAGVVESWVERVEGLAGGNPLMLVSVVNRGIGNCVGTHRVMDWWSCAGHCRPSPH